MSVQKNEIIKAAKSIIQGNLVVFPTETVYGLGADALNPDAVSKIFAVKGRPADNPIIVHLSRVKDIFSLTTDFSHKAQMLAKAFMPGPLTLVLKSKNIIPSIVRAGLPTVTVRIPDNIIALELIKLSKTFIAAPSANISGRPSPTRIEDMDSEVIDKVASIIDGGPCNVGVESTVIDMTSSIPIILRPGAITKQMIQNIIGHVESSAQNDSKPKSPGMKYRHYSPNAKIILYSGSLSNMVQTINKDILNYKDQRIGILATDETITRYNCENVISHGSRKNLLSISQNLYSSFRKFDKLNIQIILAESINKSGLGIAIMNRLSKAATKVIKV